MQKGVIWNAISRAFVSRPFQSYSQQNMILSLLTGSMYTGTLHQPTIALYNNIVISKYPINTDSGAYADVNNLA